MQFIDLIPAPADTDSTEPGGMPFSEALDRFEADLLKGLLKKHGGNVEHAAREADMNMATIYRKIKKYNIRKEEIS